MTNTVIGRTVALTKAGTAGEYGVSGEDLPKVPILQEGCLPDTSHGKFTRNSPELPVTAATFMVSQRKCLDAQVSAPTGGPFSTWLPAHRAPGAPRTTQGRIRVSAEGTGEGRVRGRTD